MTDLITRFAPSPTGNLHLGGARTALINFIISKKNSSKFYLRIEDTDKKRSKKEYTRNIINSLTWLGLNWESEPQFQSKNISKHKKVVKELLKSNNAYKCICDEEKLNEKRNIIEKNNLKIKKICTSCKDDDYIQNLTSNYSVRIKIPIKGETIIEDVVKGKVKTNNEELDDYIILRQDGTPTYMLSVVVDDHELGINYIIRGDDHFNNTFRQKYIYKFMHWKEPRYAHIPLIHGEDGNKLSKRHGAVNINDLKKIGYLPESIINNLILLGWSPKNKENEIILMKEIINKFNLENISKSSSIFSYTKLNFFNNYFLRLNENLIKFVNFCKNHEILKKYIIEDQNKLIKIFEVYKNKINYYEEILKYINIYFNKTNLLEKSENKFENIFENNFIEFKEKLLMIDEWTKDDIEKYILLFLKEKNIKFPIFGKPLRFILIKSFNGPSLSDILYILGKKDSMVRLNQYITKS